MFEWRQLSRRFRPLMTVFLALGLLLAGSMAAVAATDEVCGDFDKKHMIRSLGGKNAFSTSGADTLVDLQTLFVENRADLERVLAERGVAHLTDEIFDAIASGQGVIERDLANGETFQWMALRRGGVPASAGPLCVNSKKTWGAWEIQVSTQRDMASTPPKCELSVAADCLAGTLKVDAAGSTSDVEVTMAGDSGSRSVISGGSTSWEGTFDDRFRKQYSFKAVAQRAAEKEVTNYTFVIPKACLNLALISESKSSATGEMLACEKTVKVDVCPAGAASCELTMTSTRVRTGDEVGVNVAGHHPGGLEGQILDGKGNVLEPVAFAEDGTGTVSFARTGRYTVQATSTNEIAETAACEDEVLVVGPRWAVRGFGGPINTGTAEVDQSQTLASGEEERLKAVIDNGTLFGFGAEYYFNRRWGIEASVMFGEVDARFMADMGDLWDMADDDLGMTIFTIGPNFHLTPDHPIDLYVGAFLGLASLDSPDWSVFGERVDTDVDDDEVFGLQLGADFPLGANSPWALGVVYRYMSLTAEDKNDRDFSLDLDPSILTGGISYRF